ncbi:hypothetical protein NW752_007124 [Fusarium irregulare]|uniref:Mucoidy inhibitor-like protein n=1 Tax=Fusarium irregulare TaxID=2494466 RepID=A0A9W8PM69_9HYPO|nr:hypothetical protein NW766_007983 [Fusarium irregulare]KAJ4014365.1 hypothetical protein NW752_007124 [Fusarium irregulare]
MLDLPSAFAADVGHNVEYNIRDLGTRSVTLFPAQAHVKRDIKDVPLKPGINEISIVGLSPTIDKHSVTVEGSGAATITGISVEYLPNREIFDEVYPDSDDDDSESGDGDQDDEEPSDEPQSQTLLEVKMKLIELQDERQRAREIVGNADNRIKILDVFSNSLDKREGVNISEMLEIYQKEHTKAFEERLVGVQHERQLTEAITNATKEHSRLARLAEKARAKENKSKAKIQKATKKKQEQRKKRLEKRRNEKQRVRDERARCWPRYCYTVHIQLEVHSSYTPASSRRESTSSEFDLVQRPRSKTVEGEDISSCYLILSYVTDSAFWTPSYDMQLSTVNSMGTLCFDAGLHNTTSETWENCKITLSTSQASSSSLDESHPILTPWRIKLGSRSSGHGSSDVLESNAERQQKAFPRNKGSKPPQSHSRRMAFGIGGNALEDYQMQLMLLEQQNKKRSMMARQEHSSGPPLPPSLPPNPAMSAMRANQMQESQQTIEQRQMQQQQQVQMQQKAQAVQTQQLLEQQGDLVDFDFDQFLHGPSQDAGTPEAQPSIEFQNSLVEETGFTTTFDLPGLKTLVPKFTVSKQRVARLQFTNIQFSHTIVAKYQPVAYLKAKLKNTSKLTLFPGPASLTLDGSFMGQTKIPQCSSGGRFTLGLGVDSSIKVIYPKPDVRRSTSGMFNKEDSSVYVRTVTVHNTRVTAEKPVNLLVLDQIPVSEDDRLRVELSTPRGLTAEGPSQPAGAPGRESAEDKDWGKATASLKKYGQISWDVLLNAGKAVKLRLEYAVSMPSGDVAKEC